MNKLNQILINSFNKQLERLNSDLESYNDKPLIHKILGMDVVGCYRIFGHTNDNINDVAYLTSMLSNGLWDDAVLTIQITKGAIFSPSYKIVWGSDDDHALTEDDVNSVVDLMIESIAYRGANKKILDSGVKGLENTPTFTKYINYTQRLDALFYKMGSDDNRKFADALEVKAEFHYDDIMGKGEYQRRIKNG